MVTCAECGREYHDCFDECPYCYVLEMFERERIQTGRAICPTCGDVHEDVCPECGRDFTDTYCIQCGTIRQTGQAKEGY